MERGAQRTVGRQVAVLLSPEAVADLHDAHDRYRQIAADLADAFAEAVEGVIERLTLFPHSGTPVEGFGDLRRARLTRFPYGVFYRLTDRGEVRILRVLHDRQDRPSGMSAPPTG
ncbi:hypothetical protein CGZ93_01345 [Enemella dayhoffiae]|uniref:Type II toxin-antitoxin system RelE/ParE family toxin n=1 Tax=Enemella dayhoffiae TaxID=2016507 RepID=A0A255HB62_9ACTN|nr:hypothetical protein CGZ93_01345 [Enemella dayhoffiae]